MLLTAWVPALVTLGVTLSGITGASFWGDEAATLSAVQRPLPALWRMLGNVDAVHGTYYFLTWVAVRLAGTGELGARLPSALAMAAAAAGIAAIGRRMVSARAGLAAGLAFAAFPVVSRFGQEARPYAMVTALAVLASYLLVRALEADGRRRGWLAGYALALACLGAMNLMGLLLIPAHAVSVAGLAGHPVKPADRGAAAGDGRAGARLVVGWLAAVAASLAAVSPLALVAWHQRGQDSWIPRPTAAIPADLLAGLTGSLALLEAITLAAMAGLCWDRTGGARATTRLARLCVPWLTLPPAILLAASLVHPVYLFRYVLYCVPALALLAGAGIAELSWAGARTMPVMLAVLGILAIFGMPAQLSARTPTGHGDNLRLAAQILAAEERPGDIVLYNPDSGLRVRTAAYASAYTRLRDAGLRQSPAQAGNFEGTVAPKDVILDQIAGADRIWVIANKGHRYHSDPVLSGLLFGVVHSWRVGSFRLTLLERGKARVTRIRSPVPHESRRSASPASSGVTESADHAAAHSARSPSILSPEPVSSSPAPLAGQRAVQPPQEKASSRTITAGCGSSSPERSAAM